MYFPEIMKASSRGRQVIVAPVCSRLYVGVGSKFTRPVRIRYPILKLLI